MLKRAQCLQGGGGEYELSSLDRQILTSQNLHGVGNSSEEDKLNYFLTGMAYT